MIKGMIFVDGRLDYKPITDPYGILNSESVEGEETPVNLLPIDAGWGHSNNQRAIDDFLVYPHLGVIITNSLGIFNDSAMKDVICGEEDVLLKNYYFLDNNHRLRAVSEFTDKELHKYHNLEKLYMHGGFEKLEDLEKC